MSFDLLSFMRTSQETTEEPEPKIPFFLLPLLQMAGLNADDLKTIGPRLSQAIELVFTFDERLKAIEELLKEKENV